jgi:small-conductance mechanosensitive channel
MDPLRVFTMTTNTVSKIFHRLNGALVAACFASIVGTAAAQAGGPAAAPPSSPPEVAAVVVDGRTLMTVRGISALPAADRARAIAQRIEDAAAEDTLAATAVRTVDLADRTHIVFGDRTVMSVFDADAALENLGQRQVLAELYATKIGRAIEQYRQERGAPYLREHALRAVIALASLGALLALIWLAFRRLDFGVARRFTAQMEAVETRSFNLLTAEQLQRTVEGTIHAIRSLIVFAVVFVGLEYVLNQFPWTRLVAVRAANLVIEPLRTMGGALLGALPGIVFIAVLIVVARYALRLLGLFFGGIASQRISFRGFSQDWAWPTYRLVRLVIIAFAVIVAYPYIPGSGSDAFKGVSLFLGLLMSLGAASAVANSLAGYTLIYRRAFRVGDRIQVGNVIGDVTEMRQQVTHLRTVKNEEITIPSSMMLNSHVVNFSALARAGGLILHTTVGIGYETPWRQVEAMLLLAASRTPGLKPDPSPFVLVKSLGDFAVVHELNAYCDNAQAMEATYAALHRNILDVFNEYGVAIMTPAYVSDPEAPKVVPRDQWFLAPAKSPT